MIRFLIALIFSTVGLLGQTCIGNNAVDWTGLLVYWKMDEGTGQFLRNYVHPTDSHANEIAMPEQNFNRAQFFSKSGLTATDRIAVGPNGFTNATQITATSGSKYLQQTSHSFVSGSYTMSIWAKSATGGNQFFRFASDDGALHYSPDQTVTTSWQRFTWTWVATAGTGKNVYIISDVAGDNFDIYIFGWQLEQAASASTYESPNFHGMLGTRVISDPQDVAWSGQFLDCTGSKYISCLSGTPYSVTNWTIYALSKWTASPVLSAYGPFVCDQDFNRKMVLGCSTTAIRSPIQSYANGVMCNAQGTGGGSAISFAESTKNDWHVVVGTYDGANAKVYLDGQFECIAAVSPYAFELNTLFIGNMNFAAYWAGSLAECLVYTNAHTQAQIIRNSEAMRHRLIAKAGTQTKVTKFVAFEGDSITVMDADKYPYYCCTNLPVISGRQFAVSGSTIADMVSRESVVTSYLYQNGCKHVLSILIGANDLLGLGAATWTANLKSYCLTMRASGWKIVLCTVLPTTAVGFNTERATANSNIHADPSFYDALADLAADPTIGCDACAADLTYYSDGTHPTAAGQAIIGPIVRAAIDSL